MKQCAVASEAFNVIDVFYADKNGYVCPPITDRKKTLKRIPEQFSRMFVECKPTAKLRPKSYLMDVPVGLAPNQKPQMKRVSIPTAPGPAVNVTHVNEGIYYIHAPQQKDGPAPLSPEVEDDAGSIEGKEKGIEYALQWPEPFDLFWPTGGGADILFFHGEMREILAMLNGRHHDRVLRYLEDLVGEFTKQVTAPLGRADVFPELRSTTYEERREAILDEVMDKVCVRARSEEELLSLPAVQTYLETPVPVTRVYGIVGLLLLDLQRHVATRTVIRCKNPNCGNLIWNPNGKQQYCEEQECRRTRGRERTRRSRRKS
jgi:hypothetical protein